VDVIDHEKHNPVLIVIWITTPNKKPDNVVMPINRQFMKTRAVSAFCHPIHHRKIQDGSLLLGDLKLGTLVPILSRDVPQAKIHRVLRLPRESEFTYGRKLNALSGSLGTEGVVRFAVWFASPRTGPKPTELTAVNVQPVLCGGNGKSTDLDVVLSEESGSRTGGRTWG
jgi:hypothetical protein